MVEKFSDFEGQQWLQKEGTFEFEVMEAELKDSSKGNPMVEILVQAPEGQTKLYFSLNPKARWNYNNFIKVCLHLDTKEKIDKFMCDYETIHNDLIGKHFLGEVECGQYEKPIKRVLDDGTFADDIEVKESYKIKSYEIA